MKLRFIVVSAVNWVHYAHFLCRYSNLNQMCNFLRALNSWLSMFSSPVSAFPARPPLFSDLVNRPAAAACTCARWRVRVCQAWSGIDTPARIFICLLLGIYAHTPFADLKQEGGEVSVRSTVTPPCFPQATGSAFSCHCQAGR